MKVFFHQEGSGKLSHLCLLTASLIYACEQAGAAGRVEAKDIVAIQLRAQGIPCTNPERAIRDGPDSRPDEAAWVITCEEATYRVQLIPHIGSRVQVIDPSEIEGDIVEMKE
jgi:hypothetical protein